MIRFKYLIVITLPWSPKIFLTEHLDINFNTKLGKKHFLKWSIELLLMCSEIISRPVLIACVVRTNFCWQIWNLAALQETDQSTKSQAEKAKFQNIRGTEEESAYIEIEIEIQIVQVYSHRLWKRTWTHESTRGRGNAKLASIYCHQIHIHRLNLSLPSRARRCRPPCSSYSFDMNSFVKCKLHT